MQKSQHCLKENYVINMNRLLKVILRVNWLASIRINCMLPFRQAIRFPILFYGKCECLKIGKLILEIPETNIKLGIIKIGLKFDIGTESPSGAMINHKGTIIFKGSGVFGNGFRLFGDSRSVFIIGHNFVLNGNINVRCEKRIQIGTCFSCSWDTKICDTDYHYIENIETNFTEPKSLPIVIGNCVWVGQGVTISKGAVIPDWTIISQHSLVNQVYKLPPYCVIGGFPARLLTHKKLRRPDIYELFKKGNGYLITSGLGMFNTKG